MLAQRGSNYEAQSGCGDQCWQQINEIMGMNGAQHDKWQAIKWQAIIGVVALFNFSSYWYFEGVRKCWHFPLVSMLTYFTLFIIVHSAISRQSINNMPERSHTLIQPVSCVHYTLTIARPVPAHVIWNKTYTLLCWKIDITQFVTKLTTSPPPSLDQYVEKINALPDTRSCIVVSNIPKIFKHHFRKIEQWKYHKYLSNIGVHHPQMVLSNMLTPLKLLWWQIGVTSPAVKFEWPVYGMFDMPTFIA